MSIEQTLSPPPATNERGAPDCSGRASVENSEMNLAMDNDIAPKNRNAKPPLDRDDARVTALDRVHRVSRFYSQLQEAAA